MFNHAPGSVIAAANPGVMSMVVPGTVGRVLIADYPFVFTCLRQS